MSNRMPESYFNEKQEKSSNLLQSSIQSIIESEVLVKRMEYAYSDETDSAKVHEFIERAVQTLLYARRDFEKALWASSETSVSFKEWLLDRNLNELVMGEGD